MAVHATLLRSSGSSKRYEGVRFRSTVKLARLFFFHEEADFCHTGNCNFLHRGLDIAVFGTISLPTMRASDQPCDRFLPSANGKPPMMFHMMKKKPIKKQRHGPVSVPDDRLFYAKPRKRTPHEFVLEALAEIEPRTNPMFGCLAVYVGEKIVMILRDKRDQTAADDGVWLATSKDHHQSLRCEFPNMRSIAVFGKKVTGWQVLPADAADFETAALRACELVVAEDPRIGKIPQKKRKRPR